MSKMAARVFDRVAHPVPGMLMPGPGSSNVLIGTIPAWRGLPAAAAAALQAAKAVSDAVVTAAEAAKTAAMGTPGAPAAIAAEQAAKAAATAAMSSMMSGLASACAALGGMPDMHVCATPPIPPPPHGPGMVIDGSPTVLINGLPACAVGDHVLEALGPLDPIIMGMPTVYVGKAGGAGGGGGLGGIIAAAIAAFLDGVKDVVNAVKNIVQFVNNLVRAVIDAVIAQAAKIAKAIVTAVVDGLNKFKDAFEKAFGKPVPKPSVPTTYGKGIKLDGDEEFRKKTIEGLDKIKKTPTGKAMLDAIDASGKTVTIKETSGGNAVTGFNNNAMQKADGTKGSGSDSTVSYNPDRTSIGSEPWETRPPEVGLAHELVHATHAADGDINTQQVQNDSKPDPSDPTKFATEMNEEVRTVGISPYDKEPYSENKIRAEWETSLPQREWY